MTLRPIKVQLCNFLLVAVAVAADAAAAVVVGMAILNLNVAKPNAGPIRFFLCSAAPL